MNISTTEDPSPFDPLNRLRPGEDRFVIREDDPVGAPALTAWAHLRRNWALRLYGTEPVGEGRRLLTAELVQCAEAEAKAMDWKSRQQGAETAEENHATYAEAVLSEAQVLAARRQKMLTELKRNLREADYLIHTLVEIDGPDVEEELVNQAMRLHTFAEEID